MTLLPIIERELRMRARHGPTYWTRFTVGLGGALVCVLQMSLGDTIGGTAAAGGYAFQGLVIAAFVICCGGCLATSDAISRERREGTLGLLFLTRVRGPDVLMGKLASAVLVNVCAVLAFLPVLMIPVLSGGVTGGEAFRKGLVLLDTLFLALAAGLWASARGNEAFKTARAAFGMVAAILAVPALVEWFLQLGGPLPNSIGLFSPLLGMTVAGDLAYRTSFKPFWFSLIAMHLLGWFLVWRAAVRLRKSLHEHGSDTVDAPEKSASPEETGLRSRRKPALADLADPIGWLVRGQRGVRAMIWMAVLFGAVFYLARIPFRLAGVNAAWLWATMWPVSLAGAIVTGSLLAWAASRFFVEARRTGELELLVTTPVGAETIVSAQWTALRRMLYWPVALMLAPSIYQIVAMWTMRGFGPGDSWRFSVTVSSMFAIVNTVLGVVALCWMGMWFGLKSQTQMLAIVRTVAWARGAPFALMLVANLCFTFFFSRILSPAPAALNALIWALPQMVVLVFYLWLWQRVKRRLPDGLRDAEPARLGFKTEVTSLWRSGVQTLQHVRHWTKSCN